VNGGRIRRDTIFAGRRAELFAGFEGSQAVPACPGAGKFEREVKP
jgi:hypothetical protein